MLNANSRQNVLLHPAVLAQRAAEALPKHAERQILTPGHAIEGDDRIYRILGGCLAVQNVLEDGRRQIADVLGVGRSFHASRDARLHLSARALAYTEVEIVEAAAAPALTADTAAENLVRLMRHVTLLGRMNATEKVAHALIDLSLQFPRKVRYGRPTFTLHLTRGDLADWLGLTVETVSRTLNQLKRAGLIDYVHAEIVTIMRPERLRDVADGKTTIQISKPKGDIT